VGVDGETLDARHILIATGATPVTLGIPSEEHLITNEEFLALETLPERIVIVRVMSTTTKASADWVGSTRTKLLAW
jgi:hypothetical protein